MKKKSLITNCLLLIVTLSLFTGCSLFRHEVAFQENKGPHGGMLYSHYDRGIEYLEFVAKPEGNNWLIQLYGYNYKLEPRDINAQRVILNITLSDGSVKILNLWNTKHFFLPFSQPGHFENKIEMGNIKEFKAQLTIDRYRAAKDDVLLFHYPY
jgi:hypothetical protein